MQSGFNPLDLLLLIFLVAFIASRFFGHKLPKGKGKKPGKGTILDFPALDEDKDRPRRDEDSTEEEGVAPPVTGRKVGPVKPLPDIKGLKGMEQVRTADPSFDDKEFISGARAAYEMYWEAYSAGDEDALDAMLAPALFEDVMDELDTAEKKGHTPRVEVKEITDAAIVDGRMHGRTAIVETKYTAEHLEFTEDAKGKVVSGSKTKPRTVSAVFTWARPVDAEDPNWELESIDPVS